MSGKPHTVEQHRVMSKSRCDMLLVGALGRDKAAEWWQLPNPEFDMQMPGQVWDTDYEAVYRYVMSRKWLC